MATKYRLLNIDSDLKLDDNGTQTSPRVITADYAGLQSDNSTAQVLDLATLLGDASSTAAPVDRVQNLVAQIQVSAPDYTTGDETYSIEVQLSDTSTFTAVRQVSSVLLFASGAATPANLISQALAPIHLTINPNYRYARLFVDVSGTSPSISLSEASLTIDE